MTDRLKVIERRLRILEATPPVRYIRDAEADLSLRKNHQDLRDLILSNRASAFNTSRRKLA